MPSTLVKRRLKIYCPNCGKEIADGAEFCPYCGYRISRVKYSKSASKKLLRVILPLILVVIAVSFGFIFFKYIKPNIVSNKKENATVLIPYRKGNKWGFCDRNKDIVIQPVYDGAGCFTEELAAVKINGKWGFIDKKGNVVIEPVYNWVEPFKEGIAMVEINGKWGYIDKEGTQYWED